MAALEDAGFYCVDNMPAALLPKLLELPTTGTTEIIGLAFVMDLREKTFQSTYTAVFEDLRKKGYGFEILFLEAGEEILLQRYSQTRRQHPLSHGKGLLEGIRVEKHQMKELRAIADRIIDSSLYSVHDLKSVVIDFALKSKKQSLMITVLSFGFKHGIPREADLIIDVRFLSNPYFVPALKDLDGETGPVKAYVLNNRATRIFLKKYVDLLDYLIPLYKKEGKKYLTIAVGCTGGRHRSVAVTRAIFEHLNKITPDIEIIHRDIGNTH